MKYIMTVCQEHGSYFPQKLLVLLHLLRCSVHRGEKNGESYFKKDVDKEFWTRLTATEKVKINTDFW